jgi:hypothetical protein
LRTRSKTKSREKRTANEISDSHQRGGGDPQITCRYARIAAETKMSDPTKRPLPIDLSRFRRLAAMRADASNYPVLRPALLAMKEKYPEYSVRTR